MDAMQRLRDAVAGFWWRIRGTSNAQAVRELAAIKALMEDGNWVTVSDYDGESVLAVDWNFAGTCEDHIKSAPTAVALCEKLGIEVKDE